MSDGPNPSEFTDLAIAPAGSEPSLQKTIGFWVGLASLSILIHLLGFWASREWGFQPSPEQTTQPIPVTMIETPLATGLTTPEAIAPPPSSQSTIQPALPTQPPQSQPQSSPPAATAPSPPVGPSITSIPGPAVPPTDPETADPPQPELPELEPGASLPPTAPGPDAPSADVPQVDEGLPLPEPPDGAISDPEGRPPAADPSLPSVEVSGGLPAPAQYLVELAVVPMPSAAVPPESSEGPAVPQPVEPERIFTADPSRSLCQITPELEADLGTPVLMQARVDAEGRVMEVQFMVAIAPDPSASPTAEENRVPLPEQNLEAISPYQQFAQCALQEWTFTVPDGGTGSVSDTVLVELTVNRAP